MEEALITSIRFATLFIRVPSYLCTARSHLRIDAGNRKRKAHLRSLAHKSNANFNLPRNRRIRRRALRSLQKNLQQSKCEGSVLGSINEKIPSTDYRVRLDEICLFVHSKI